MVAMSPCKVSFLELTSQLVRDLDFGIGGEGRRRIIAGFVVVEFSLEHGGPICRKVRAHWSPLYAEPHIACPK